MTAQKLERAKAKLEKLQEKINILENEVACNDAEQYAYINKWELHEQSAGFSVAPDFTGQVVSGTLLQNAFNAFERREVAEEFANVIHLMVAIRQCPGAGHCGKNGVAWVFEYKNGHVSLTSASIDKNNGNFLTPVFPTKALAKSAINQVGGPEYVAGLLQFLATGAVSF